MKIAVGLEYCGAAYAGWQRQKHIISVQEHVESALSKVADHEVHVQCAGRTDAGVHALQQVAHFDTMAKRDMRSWILGGNVHLPSDISILWAHRMEEDFHARFSATGRRYSYVILNRTARPGLLRRRVAWECRPLDEGLMQQAAGYLLGEHDFTSYRAVECQSETPVRNVRSLEVRRRDDFIVMEIEANAFLHHMVRNIAGVLMSIGMGEAPPAWSKQVLEACDRTQGGVTAPADGLYLVRVSYPEKYGIPIRANINMALLTL